MIVSCTACGAKFNIPDAKVAGRRARMKCKKCQAVIAIDGTGIDSPDPKSSTTSSEQPRFSPSVKRAESSSSHPGGGGPGASAPHGIGAKQPSRPVPGREPESSSAPSESQPSALSPRWQIAAPGRPPEPVALEDLIQRHQEGSFEPGTTVCAPGQNQWLLPGSHSELTQRAGAHPRNEQPTFNDETVALGAAEAEALKLQSQTHWPEPTPPGGSKATPSPTSASEDSSAFDRATPDSAGWSSAAPRKEASEGQFFDDDDVDEAMNSFDSILSEPPAREPARITKGRPAPPSGAPQPVGKTPDRRAAAERPVVTEAEEPARGPGLPPQAPAPPSRSAPPPSFRASSIPDDLLSAPEWEEDSEPVIQDSAPPGSRGRAHPQKSRGSRLWLALALLCLLAAGVAALSFARPLLFQQGLRAVESLIGRAPPRSRELPDAPAFDTPEASRRLGEVAQSLSPCREPTGPTGQGRARVLFSPSGQARSVTLDAPYADTSVGACIERRFLGVVVPAFGGQPVLVNKTFTLSH